MPDHVTTSFIVALVLPGLGLPLLAGCIAGTGAEEWTLPPLYTGDEPPPIPPGVHGTTGRDGHRCRIHSVAVSVGGDPPAIAFGPGFIAAKEDAWLRSTVVMRVEPSPDDVNWVATMPPNTFADGQGRWYWSLGPDVVVWDPIEYAEWANVRLSAWVESPDPELDGWTAWTTTNRTLNVWLLVAPGGSGERIDDGLFVVIDQAIVVSDQMMAPLPVAAGGLSLDGQGICE